MPRPSKRPDLVTRGLEVVHRNGFAASGVAEIVAAAGVPKGSFYNHFRSKDDFGNTVLLAYFAEVSEALEEELRADGRKAPARLKAYFKRLRTHNAKTGFARGCLLGNISAESSTVTAGTRTLIERLLSEWSAKLKTCVSEGQRAGDIRGDLAAARLARILLDSWQGAVLRSKVERGPAALDDFIDVLLPQLLSPRPRR
jgi:TetR/AcrR family transcriptional repressor of nem operon